MKEEEFIKRELKAFIESNIIMIKETQRIWSQKKDITDYEKGRVEGIILLAKDFNDNLFRFADLIGISFKEEGGR